ncbi:hypothetical protein G8770_19975 [Aestuariicella hydrocarbonica]|uniref:F0F1 ATP synthase subunit gamma n=1 Tax=Pseudomaricurvus hydrocarbonicus TaxID=1470433 RepID=A0A9E5T1U1_9GAMM|nr:FoF1 ATP synthase subunit gamma [Aestuariicella hydrocarbonica]NHO67830.1 hypothetical protein [Aestuariicella hydrocarbonica]
MSNLQAIRQQRKLLDEIGKIMDSIKTIALIEMQQSRHTLDNQRQGISAMQSAVSDFMTTFDAVHSATDQPFSNCPNVLILIGSERGFCGDFNARVVDTLTQSIDTHVLEQCQLIVVGYRLWNKLQHLSHALTPLSGANVAAEIKTTLAAVVELLSTAPPAGGFESVTVVFHDDRHKQVRQVKLLEGFMENPRSQSTTTSYPPLTNLAPAELLTELMGQYVYSHLNYLLTTSFVAENEQRVEHLRNALDQIDNQHLELAKKHNHLRQETITEELEIILLNTLDKPEP